MSSRNRPCPCGSGKRYKHCCGGVNAGNIPGPLRAADGTSPYSEIGYFTEPFRGQGMLQFCKDMPPGRAPSLPWSPPGVLVLDNYLDEATCAHWQDFFRRQKTTPATVQAKQEPGYSGPPRFVQDEQRITEFVPMGTQEAALKKVLFGAYRDLIAPYFSTQLAWMSPPNVLKYRPGGLYNGHSDSEFWNMETRRWIRSLDRDFSVLVYVNDDYEGGALYFPNFDLRIQPGRGMLIAFPSDHRYLHAAEPLIAGERYAIVCWAVGRDTPKINPMPRGATPA